MADLVLGRGADDASSLEAWLARNGVGEADAAAIMQQGAERFSIYRKLVRGTLRDAVLCAIPRSVARLGPVFDEYFERYLGERGPRSRYLRDVTTELLDFCAPLWPADPRVPAWAMDLARHEAVQIVVASELGRVPGDARPELRLEAPVRFIEAARLMRYAHAVHRLAEDPADRISPVAAPTALLVYRSPEHDVRYLELTPLAADILERLLRRVPLGQAVGEACASAGRALDATVVEGTAALLADLAERGALVGSLDGDE